MRLIFSIIIGSLTQIFFGVGIAIGTFLIFEIIAKLIGFLITGNWVFNFDNYFKTNDFLIWYPKNWLIDTGLIGLDKIINSFINLQYEFWGRLKMLFISIGLLFLSGAIRGIFQLKDMTLMSPTPKTCP